MVAIGNYFYNKKPETIYLTKYTTKIDTIVKFNTDTLTIKIPTLKTLYTHKIDTIIITEAFEKSFDTTTANAKLDVTYYFPSDTFKVKLQTKITEILRTDTIKYEVIVPKKDEYYYWRLGGMAAAGFILGVIIAK
jgi:hypothetical protein